LMTEREMSWVEASRPGVLDDPVSMRSSPPQSSQIADQAFGQKSRMGIAWW
jgi:hypothetical protein